MRSAVRVIALIAVIGVVALVVWLANYLVWFGPDAPPVDYQTRIREMQVGASGASLDDTRAHATVVELAQIFETLSEEEINEPASIDHDTRLDQQEPDVLAEIEEWITICEQRGVFEKVDELAGLPSYIMPSTSSALLIDLDFFEGSSALRKAVRVSGYRGRLALYAGDTRQAIDECLRMTQLAGLLLSQPIAINRLIGHAILAHSINSTRDILRHGVTESELAELMSIYDAVELFPIEDVIEGERLIAQDAVMGTFPSNRTIYVTSRGAQWARLESEFDRMRDWAQRSAYERARDLFLDAPADWRYAPADILLPAMVKIVQSHEQISLDLDAVRVEIAIERFRLSEGRLPESLDDLTPNFLHSVPRDAFAEGAPELIYHVLSTPDEMGRAYHLYSVGHDGEDNGGMAPEKSPYLALDPAHPGTDFVLHRID